MGVGGWKYLKKKIKNPFFLQERKMCPETFQPSIICCNRGTWYFLAHKMGHRVMKLPCELPRGGKMDSPGDTELRALQ